MTAQDDNQDQKPSNPQDWQDQATPGQARPERHLQALLAGYVMGELSSDEMLQVRQYLAHNPQARKEVAELEATLNLLPLSLPEDAVPPMALKAKLLASAAETPQKAPQSAAVLSPVENFQPRGRSRRLTPMTWRAISKEACFAIAATIAAALLGFQNFQLRHQLQFAQQQSERLAAIESQLARSQVDVAEYQEVLYMLRLPENRLFSLSGASDFTETSSGSVVIAPLRNWAMLTLKDLPQPPIGKAYQLWAMANGEKVYCVEFKPDDMGQVLVEIPVGNWAGTPMVSITIEDEGTIPAETSEMVMNGTII